MQNLVRFCKTSKFGGEYLWNGWRYSKSDSHSVYGDFSCVRRNKYSEVWSSDLGDLDVKSYPPKAQFSEDHISAPRGYCAPNLKIATKSKRRWQESSFGRWTKESLWNSVHYEQSYKRWCSPNLSRQGAFGVCQCIWVRATWLWCRGIFTPPSLIFPSRT